jgi:hypothetical protein
MNPLRTIRDESNGIVIGLDNPSYVNNYHFAGAGTATVTWPAGATIAHIISTATFYQANSGTAAVPTVDVTNGTASRNSPAFVRKVGADFSLAVGAAAEICVEFYS